MLFTVTEPLVGETLYRVVLPFVAVALAIVIAVRRADARGAHLLARRARHLLDGDDEGRGLAGGRAPGCDVRARYAGRRRLSR